VHRIAGGTIAAAALVAGGIVRPGMLRPSRPGGIVIATRIPASVFPVGSGGPQGAETEEGRMIRLGADIPRTRSRGGRVPALRSAMERR
jgi:hypothetical protein